METNQESPRDGVPNEAEGLSKIPNPSEEFRSVPNTSERFRTIPNVSETFRTVPKPSERKENHTLTVREVARRFEDAGVARTERSIINWCQANQNGVARLDAYLDPNDRKYYITPESADRAIQEEQARSATGTKGATVVPNASETPSPKGNRSESEREEELKAEIRDLQIATRVKDLYIEDFKRERERFSEERKAYVEDLKNSHRRLGELETELKQLSAGVRGGQSIDS